MASPRVIREGARDAIARAAAELAAVPPFSELTPVDRARLAATLEQVTYDAGDVIFAQGAPADALYILRQGLVERRAGGVRLDVLEPPAVFGDLALLRDQTRATTLTAVTHCVVWRLPADRFTRVLRRTPAIATFFASAVSTRLATRQQEVAELAREFDSIAEHLYSSLPPRQQQILERAALLPHLDERVLPALLESGEEALPLRDIVLEDRARDGPTHIWCYRPALRRFLIDRLQQRVGPSGLANVRRQVAALARSARAPDLAVEVLLEGELVGEAVDLLDRELDDVRRTRGNDAARELLRLIPPESLVEHPHLQQAGAVPTAPPQHDQVAQVAKRRWRMTRPVLGIVLALLVLAICWPLPAPPGLSDRGWHALVALLASLPMLALDSMPDGIIALVLAAIWVVGGVTSFRIALDGFATTNWILVVSTLAVGTAIASSGLLYRTALWVVANTRGGYAGQVVALGVSGMLMGPAVPNATSRVALVAPAVTELIDAVGFPPMSGPAVGLAMAVLIGFGQIVALFLTSSSTSVLVFAVLPDASRASVNFVSWAIRALPTHIILFAGMAGFVLWRYRPREQTSMQATTGLALQRALLGPPSRQEKIAMAATAFLLVGFTTQPLHHVDGAWIGVSALAILAASGVLVTSGLAQVNWSFALLSGILTSMSDVFADTGLDKWLAGLATESVGALASTPVVFVAALAVLCYIVTLVMRWQAAAPLLTISLAPVGAAAGIDPWIIGLIALMACNGFFLPYQSTTYLALYHGTNGRLFRHAQARPAAIAYGVITVIALCASVPVWHLMGLM
ncbi:MAG: anion permease [Chloroflexi bacterium]|nr:anion permease [Chloroflexota bacterium]